MNRVIGQRRLRHGGGYPDNVCVVHRIERGRPGEARTMYVLANTAGQPQEAISRASWLRLARVGAARGRCVVSRRELGPVAQLIAELALRGLLTRRCETHPDDPSLDYVSTLAWTGLMVRRSDLSPGRITLLRLDDGTPWRWAVDTADDRLLIPYVLESAIGGAS